MSDRNVEDAVRKELIGWTVVDVAPCPGGEDYATLVVERDGVRKNMVFGGTELGGWIYEVRTKKVATAPTQSKKARRSDR